MANELKQSNPKKANLLIQKIDELLDLVWISKMFLSGNINKAQNLFDKLDSQLKNKIKKIIWRAKGESLFQLEEEKQWIMPAALMNYVSEQVNA